jgi:hypothetical protein
MFVKTEAYFFSAEKTAESGRWKIFIRRNENYCGSRHLECEAYQLFNFYFSVFFLAPHWMFGTF